MIKICIFALFVATASAGTVLLQNPQQFTAPIYTPTTDLRPIQYSAPIQHSAPIQYSAPIKYAYPAIPAGPHVTRHADRVEIVQQPIEQHGYVVKY